MSENSQPQKIRVNLISESEFTVQGHGVHTAFVEMREALRRHPLVELSVNSKNADFDIVHTHTIGFFALRRLLFSRGKKVISAHVVPDSFIGSLRAAKYWRPLAKWWLKHFYKQGDLVLACSGMVRDELAKKMKLKNVDLLYNTIEMSRYKIDQKTRLAARQKLGLADDDFMVLGNGQVQPRKRIDTFFNVAKALPEDKFFWVGGMPFGKIGADYQKMQKMIAEPPANVTVTGLIPLEDVRTYYQAADVFTLPAMQENHPMCVLEAAGAGLPIVLRAIAEYDDTFRGDALMAASDEEFVARIQKLKNDQNYYQKAVAGSRRIAKRFDSNEGAKRVVEFYNQLLQRQ